jgi:cholesterol oxidase
MQRDRNHRWLSHGVEVLVQEMASGTRAGDLDCEVLIVGSGYGGAVAAARLASALPAAGGPAISVFVLERGNEYLPGDFPSTFAELPGHVRISTQDGNAPKGRPAGLFDLRMGDKVSALLGNGLGGGSLINAAVMERPTADAFQAGWPSGMDLTSLDGSYRAAEDMLEREQIDTSVPKLASLLELGGVIGATEYRKANVAVAFADHINDQGVAVKHCLKCGDCVSGCNHSAKKSLDVNYLAMAEANGARLFCGATVHALRHVDAGRTVPAHYEVDFWFTDPNKARTDRATPYVLKARRVILAAGTLGSTEILLRSRAQGLPIADGDGLPEDDPLGKNFSTNGDLIAVAFNQKREARSSAKEGDAPDKREIGPTITGLVRQAPGSGRPLVIEEFAIPGPLRRLFSEVVTTCASLDALGRTDRSVHRSGVNGVDPLAVDDALLERTPVYGMMGDDGADGCIELRDAAVPGTDGHVYIHWPSVADKQVFKDQIAALQEGHAPILGLGGRVLPNPLWQPLPAIHHFDEFKSQIVTVHPLGGCRMADGKSDGVVDPWGRVYARDGDQTALLDGLAVLDGSIVPVSLGINPSLTIAALAERAVHVLASAWGLTLRTTSRQQTQPRPIMLTPAKAPAPVKRESTKVMIRERLVGELDFGSAAHSLSAVAAFDPTEVAAFRNLPRVIKQHGVALTFTDASGDSSSAVCEGEASVLGRERSTYAGRVARSWRLARQQLGKLVSGKPTLEDIKLFIRLCSHFGEVRTIVYRWTVTGVAGKAPVRIGDTLQLTKRLEFIEGGNPWRQLSEGQVSFAGRDLGRLTLDLTYFVEQLAPLITIDHQQDEPNAIGDLAELALWIARIVLNLHLPNFIPVGYGATRTSERLPAKVNGVDPDLFGVPTPKRDPKAPKRRLARYASAATDATLRPALLIHGFGASGSTFAHPLIPHNLVETLMTAGREVWVLDMRTSIGLNQTDYWSFEDVATHDIPDAIAFILTHSPHKKIDVVAHCIGAAMFSVAVLSAPSRTGGMHEHIGAVVLSQVAPLLQPSPANRFRGFVASYLRQFIGIEDFYSRPIDEFAIPSLAADAILATYPYPDDDGEAARAKKTPGFEPIRHRADAIFGQTMRLSNIGDTMLGALDAIYGYVNVQGLAQVINYARERLVTDEHGMNQVIAYENFVEQFNFPVLIIHGRQNAVFNWHGSQAAHRLLQKIFAPNAPLQSPQPGAGYTVLGEGTQRRLMVFDEYGHQDTLIGQNAHADVFVHITKFLTEFETYTPTPVTKISPIRPEFPWMGPVLGRAEVLPAAPDRLHLRLAVRPPPARASAQAVAYVPAWRKGDVWSFDFENMAVGDTTRDDLLEKALDVDLFRSELTHYQGFAIVTIHNDLPVNVRIATTGVMLVGGLFAEPARGPSAEVHRQVEAMLSDATQESLAQAIVCLDESWIETVGVALAPDTLTLALASCQYPAGLVDRKPAMASHARLAALLEGNDPKTKPQMLLLVGDQVYVDETAGLFVPSAFDPVDFAYQQNFRLEAFREVTRRLPTYSMLDDHEVRDDWEPGSLELDDERRALKAYQNNQFKSSAEKPAQPIGSYRFGAAGFSFFMLDTRSERQRRVLRPPAAGAALLEEALILAGADMQAFTTWLAAQPNGVPRFIVSPVALLPFAHAALGPPVERLALDDWGGYAKSQFEMLSLLYQAGTKGPVIVLSGDRHLSSVSSFWMDGPQKEIEIVSIVSSGLYAPWPFANSRAEEFCLSGGIKMDTSSDPADRHTITGTMNTAMTGTTSGYARVRIERDSARGANAWSLAVTLDLEAGVTSCGRTLGVKGDKDWVRTTH